MVSTWKKSGNHRFNIQEFQKIYLIILITTNWAFGNASVIPPPRSINGTISEILAAKPNSTRADPELVPSEEQVFYGFPQNYPWGLSYVPVQYVPQQQPPKVHTTGPKSEFELVDTKHGSLNNRLRFYPGYQVVYV